MHKRLATANKRASAPQVALPLYPSKSSSAVEATLTTHLEELVELDGPVLVEVHLLDHVPDLVAGDVLAQGLEHVADFRGGDVTIAVRIELEREKKTQTDIVDILRHAKRQKKINTRNDNVDSQTRLPPLHSYPVSNHATCSILISSLSFAANGYDWPP